VTLLPNLREFSSNLKILSFLVALTDGHSVSLDINGKPYFHSKGIVSRNVGSKWMILCDENGDFVRNASSIATDICNIIGFKSMRNVRVVSMSKDDMHIDIDIRRREKDEIARSIIRSSTSIDTNHVDACLALEVECSPFQAPKKFKNVTSKFDEPKLVPVTGNATFLRPQHEQFWNHLMDFYWPWTVEVFSNGNLVGVGVLIDRSWVLVEKSVLGSDENPLKLNHVTALVGTARSFLKIKSPYEQISKVDCVQHVNDSNVMLLHLQKHVHFNRHALPLFLPYKDETKDKDDDEVCLAVAVAGMRKNLKSLELEIVKNCGTHAGEPGYRVKDGLERKMGQVCWDSGSKLIST
jgi:hypothetical protein